MNGVRRFLGNPTAAITKDRPGTSRSPSPTKELPPPPSAAFSTRGLFIRKDRKPLPPVAGPSSTNSSPTTTTPPLRRKAPPPEWEEPPDLPPHPPTNGGQLVNTRDALLLSLMSSEAMVDSRGYEILSAEEVEELKKEHTILSSRVGALQRKLATEIKIRDAAQNLARLNASSSSTPSSSTHISRQSTTALETAERKVEAAQTELWRVQERAANVDRRLLEHPCEEHDDGDGPLSPMSSVSGAGALAPKFDGAHLFAGNAGAVVPGKPRGARARQREAEFEDARAAVEAELDDARAAAAAAADLADARAAAESELAQEQAALEQERERAIELEGRVAFLELELESSSRGNDDALRLRERVRALERELSDTVGAAEAETAVWATEKATWAAERARFEQQEAQLTDDIENERSQWEQEREELAAQAKDQIATAADGLRALVQRFDVPLFSRESGLGVLVDALQRHLEKQTQSAQEFEGLLTAEVEKRAAMSQELETAKEEIQTLRTRSPSSRPSSTQHPSEPRPTSSITFAKDAAGFVAILQPLWATLPSPEARAARLSGATRPFRAGNGRSSPSLRAGTPGSPGPSISDLDVRALKSLYTPGTNTNGSSNGASAALPNSGPGTPGSPRSPVVDGGGLGPGTFSVEATDRALMERLIRFAQAHDLLKKNAERAQKLAQDSNAALETYQRQVRMLEEQLASSDGLQEQVDQLAAEKLAVEERAAEQAETLRQLTEANAVLSARALQLAEDAAAAQEELRAVNTASEREQTQRLALLEEINLVQTENGSLRQQLRALGKL
ncbi:Up-regulated during septation-domain-containing protein [Lactarius akahatsu]|uniref:Up-regulated during septation-domain-containing protein n=1 Tax=Lactarius akahatsu TaxID=416441 RepID=A0AAD4LG52_9AGAM|nr:Up-regulated during septation-domain-containing protein [Lactarius akahatsu]